MLCNGRLPNEQAEVIPTLLMYVCKGSCAERACRCWYDYSVSRRGHRRKRREVWQELLPSLNRLVAHCREYD
jgi:hypothetical protein